MSTPWTAVAIGTCAVFGWSGLAKASHPHPFVASVRELRLGFRPAFVAAVVVALEIAVPLSVVAGLNTVGAGLVMVLGASFAAVGIWAVVRRLNVPCRCFGQGSTRSLGWYQVALLPLWAIGGYSIGQLSSSSLEGRLDVAAICLAVMTVLQALAGVRQFSRARTDRRAYSGG